MFHGYVLILINDNMVIVYRQALVSANSEITRVEVFFARADTPLIEAQARETVLADVCRELSNGVNTQPPRVLITVQVPGADDHQYRRDAPRRVGQGHGATQAQPFRLELYFAFVHTGIRPGFRFYRREICREADWTCVTRRPEVNLFGARLTHRVQLADLTSLAGFAAIGVAGKDTPDASLPKARDGDFASERWPFDQANRR